MFDCNEDMNGYHGEEVNLAKVDQDEMRERRNNGRIRLKTGLEKDGKPLPSEIKSQGSYAMRTMVQDDECDYDIDDGVYFEKDDLRDGYGNFLTPAQARQRVADALMKDKRLAADAEVKDNCVRQKYPQGYHIDIPVYRITRSKDSKDNEIVQYELASKTDWIVSDAREVTRWYEKEVGSELKSGEQDYSQLRRITRLTKKLARSRDDWKAKTASGIIITKLVVDHFQAAPGRDDESLRDTWNRIKSTLDYDQNVVHPVLKGTHLAHHGDNKVKFLGTTLGDALKILEILDDEDNCTIQKARKAWDDVFGSVYFSGRPDDDDDRGGSKGRGISPIVSGVAKRNDGGGRYG